MKFSEVKDEWETPPDLYKALDEEFNFDIDVAATIENYKAKVFTENGLEGSWEGFRVYCNPPYSNWRPWVEKAHTECVETGRCPLAVLLLPVDTSTKVFHEYIWNKPHAEVRFLSGRLTFWYRGGPGPYPARFASMVVVFRAALYWGDGLEYWGEKS